LIGSRPEGTSVSGKIIGEQSGVDKESIEAVNDPCHDARNRNPAVAHKTLLDRVRIIRERAAGGLLEENRSGRF
jgi:hypothetical protein